MKFRIENDALGDIKVNDSVYWGAQTERSKNNFNIGDEKFSILFIKSYALVKQISAEVNAELGLLDIKIEQLIKRVTQEIIDEKLNIHFPLSIWQTGSGTQTNMNLNEVIANRANEIYGSKKGCKYPVHPNDHVNKSQSTNDSFSTAMNVSVVFAIYNQLINSIDELIKTFDEKSDKFMHIIKMGRTHLQDAVPISLGQEISAWSFQLKEAKNNIRDALKGVFYLAQGGTAVGTGLNAHSQYANKFAEKISYHTNLSFLSSKNKFASISSHDDLVFLSGSLSALATSLLKIVNDIRWLSSGPRGGLCEIFISANEPGSSIMPGKVNPTQAEAMSMICCQVIGNNMTVNMANSQGNFQLNVFKPVIIFNILQAILLLSDGMHSFNEKCAKSIKPNVKQLNLIKDRSLMLVTVLTPIIGYDNAAQAAKKAHADGSTLKEAVVSLKLMSDKKFDSLVKPELMVNLF